MKSLKNLLDKKRARNQLFRKTSLDKKDVFYIFKKVIQEEFGNIGVAKLKPDYFAKKILHIKSESSVWASELWLNKNSILKKINKEIGSKEIEEIKMK